MAARRTDFFKYTVSILLMVCIINIVYLLMPQTKLWIINPKEIVKMSPNDKYTVVRPEYNYTSTLTTKIETHPKLLLKSTSDVRFCHVSSPWAVKAIKYKTKSNMRDWRFLTKNSCPAHKNFEIPKERQQVFLECNSDTSYMKVKWTEMTNGIEKVKFGSRCLVEVIDRCCNNEPNKVPNVAHFVWYKDRDLEFIPYIALMSVLRFMKPCLILIHGGFMPRGTYWDKFISFTPNVIHVNRERPVQAYGHKLAYMEHASDLMRIEALQVYGGVYLDYDQVLLRPIEPLRIYTYTQGHETPNCLGSQLIMAQKNATFLTSWHHSYRDDYKTTWNYNALQVPWKIAQDNPHLIHVEGFNFTRPDWERRSLIFDDNYDWSTNYGMHLFIRAYRRPIDSTITRTLNTTIGSVIRHILFGDKELCFN